MITRFNEISCLRSFGDELLKWTPNVDSRLLIIQMYTQEEITLNINFLSLFLVSLRLVNRHDPKKKIVLNYGLLCICMYYDFAP